MIRGNVGIATALGVLQLMVFPQFGDVKRDLGGFATIQIPRRMRLDAPGKTGSEHPTWVGFRMDRIHTWAMGSFTPYRTTLCVNLHAPNAATSSYDEALARNERYLNGGGGPESKQIARDATWDITQGRYQVNLLDEPVWRIKYRDPSRRVSILFQVYQKDWKLDDARQAIVKMAESVRRVREPDFEEIADRPRKQLVENERKANAAFDWLAARGYGRLTPDAPVTRNGITVEFRSDPERRLMILRLIPGKPMAPLPDYVSYGSHVWTAAEGWQDVMPDNDYYPAPGTKKLLDETLSRPGPHYYLIRTIRLDEVDEASYQIADFFAFASAYR